MSAKDSMSSNKAKEFFVEHGEKVAFGFCVLLVAVFFLLGQGVKGLDDTKTPSALRQRVEAANQHMAVDRWTEVKNARTPDTNLPSKVKLGRDPVPGDEFVTYLKDPAPEPQALREDPELIAPSKPVTGALIAALPSPPRSDLPESPLDLLPLATVKQEEEKPVRRSSRPRVSAGGDDYGGELGGSGSGAGFDDYGDESASEGVDMMGEEQESEYRKVYPSLIRRLKGYRVSAGIPESFTIVVGTATVPVKEQWEQYKRKLENAIGFEPMRDRPIYMWYEVERQDVTETSPDEAEWKLVTTSWNYESWYRKRYGAGPPPIVDLAYYEGKTTPRRHDYALTSPIPLVLMKDIEPLVLHPTTPKRKPEVETEEDETEDEDDTVDPRIGPMGPPDASEGDEYGDSMESGYDGAGGGSGGDGYGDGMETQFVDFDPETGPAAPTKLIRFFDLNSEAGRKYRYRVRVALVDPNNPLAAQGDAMMSGGESSGESMSSDAYSGSSMSAESATMEGDVSAEVSLRWLDKDVRDRVEAIRQNDLNDPRNNGQRRVEWRYTDWSEPSDVVTVPTRSEQVLAGSVTPPKETRIDDDTSYAREEPKGTLVVSQWIPYYAVDVPAEKEVGLGSLLNFEADADVLHPIKLMVKRIEKQKFETDALVLDIRGGQELPGSDKEKKITAPGEFLVLDGEGNLLTQRELDDMEDFRLKLLIPDEEDIQVDDGYGDMSADSEDGGFYDAAGPER